MIIIRGRRSLDPLVLGDFHHLVLRHRLQLALNVSKQILNVLVFDLCFHFREHLYELGLGHVLRTVLQFALGINLRDIRPVHCLLFYYLTYCDCYSHHVHFSEKEDLVPDVGSDRDFKS